MESKTSSTKEILEATERLYDQITDKRLLVRRINITANKVVNELDVVKEDKYEQLNLFVNYEERKLEEEKEKKEKELQHTIINIKKKFGKNSVIKGMNLEEGGTMLERNKQIGGHKE